MFQIPPTSHALHKRLLSTAPTNLEVQIYGMIIADGTQVKTVFEMPALSKGCKYTAAYQHSNVFL